MAASPMAETADVAVRCPHAVGMPTGERQRRTLRLAGWPAAGRPGMGRSWRRPRRGYPQFHSPWHLPLSRRLSCVFARTSRSLMHTLLSWQLKKPQTGTSKHELKERACHSPLSALPRGGQEMTLTSSAC
jgi:hypothetical protein